MESEKDQDVEAFNLANAALRAFVAGNADTLNEFRRLSRHFNDALETLRDRAKSLAKEKLGPARLGPCAAKPVMSTRVNFDALEELVTDEEFRSVVDIEYRLRGERGAEGRAALQALQLKYGDRLAGLESQQLKQVNTSGPKALDLTELEVML